MVAVAVVAAIAVGLLVGLAGFLWWLSSQWYVGQTNGYVTISQGVPQHVVGVPLSRVTTTTALEVDELPHYDQSQVTMTIDAGTEAEAQRIVVQLGLKIAACGSTSPPLGCPVGTDEPGAPAATPSPTSSPVAAWTTGAAAGVSP